MTFFSSCINVCCPSVRWLVCMDMIFTENALAVTHQKSSKKNAIRVQKRHQSKLNRRRKKVECYRHARNLSNCMQNFDLSMLLFFRLKEKIMRELDRGVEKEAKHIVQCKTVYRTVSSCLYGYIYTRRICIWCDGNKISFFDIYFIIISISLHLFLCFFLLDTHTLTRVRTTQLKPTKKKLFTFTRQTVKSMESNQQ